MSATLSDFFVYITFPTLFLTSFAQHQFAKCDYKIDDSNVYKCELTLNIPNGIAKIDEILGTHEPNMTDDDVRIIETTFVSSAEYIPALICEKFVNTERIFIQTGLEQIDEDALRKCSHLQHLNLFFNKIKKISENAFDENRELNFVDLSGNQLSLLPSKLFRSQSSSLKTLLLQGNPNLLLSPDFFKHIPNLTSLSLSTYHPGWFSFLENLDELNIGPSGALELPKNLFSSLKNMRLLFLNEKNVTILHADSFGELPNLKLLWMKNNRIEAIDEKIFEQTGIIDVNLEGNVCADDRFLGDDNSEIMKGLRKCFETYKGRGN